MSLSKPDTIFLVHGLWVTPRSWENWIAHYESKGFKVLAPAYPGFEIEVEALREDPTVIAEMTIAKIVDNHSKLLDELDSPPIIMGHSAGGALTQILLDRGYGAAGVTFNSAPTEGAGKISPPSQIKATFEILKNPTNIHKAVGFSLDQWKYAFTNGFPEELARETYERYHIPAPGHIIFHGVLANLQPGKQDAYVDYKNDSRAPLLFISGTKDNIMPPSVQQSNFKHYKSNTITEIEEFDGPHLMAAQENWQELADRALEWALENAGKSPALAE